MLAGLALKRRWQEGAARRREAGPAPNMVFGARPGGVGEVRALLGRRAPLRALAQGDVFRLTADRCSSTSTRTRSAWWRSSGRPTPASYEPIGEIAAALDARADGGLDVPLHVDGASGGFVAPFIQQDIAWDFRLPSGSSISASGHKYGLGLPGRRLGPVAHVADVPADLIFHVTYLGGDMPTLALNFSRPGSQVVAAVLPTSSASGFEGYRLRAADLPGRRPAPVVSRSKDATGRVPPSSPVGDEPPVFVVRRSTTTRLAGFMVYDSRESCASGGWQAPGVHDAAEPRGPLRFLRIVVRNGLSHDMADMFLGDLQKALAWFDSLDAPMPHTREDLEGLQPLGGGVGRRAGRRRRPAAAPEGPEPAERPAARPARPDRGHLRRRTASAGGRARLFAVGSTLFLVPSLPGAGEVASAEVIAITYFAGVDLLHHRRVHAVPWRC